MPRSARSSSTCESNSSRRAGATPATGSSRRIRRGAAIRIRARSSSFRWPPESVPDRASACPSSRTSRSSSCAVSVTSSSRRRAAVRRATTPQRCSPGCSGAASRTLSSTVIRVSARAVWNVRPSPARTIRCGGRRSMRWPSSSIRPASARTKPEMQLKSVDFPAPFGPISAVIEPASTTREASSTARTPAKALLTPRASSSVLIRGSSRPVDRGGLAGGRRRAG